MAKTAKKEKPESTDMSEVLKHLRKTIGRPLFMPSTRRTIPMRHRALGELLSGPDHPGLPTGCFIEVVGEAHAGKTSVTFAMIDAVINQPPHTTHRIRTEKGIEEIDAPRKVLVIDSEHMWDLQYLTQSVPNVRVLQVTDKGTLVNPGEANVWIHQPDTLEEGGDVFIGMTNTGEFGLIVIDSIPALLPKAEREKAMGERTVGVLAQAMGKLLRMTTPVIANQNVTVILVNQWRDKVGVVFGDPRTSPGGKASAYFDAIKVNVSGAPKTPWFDEGKLVVVKAMKNKIFGGKRTCEYHLQRGYGISAEIEAIVAASQCGAAQITSRERPVFAIKGHVRGDKKKVRWLLQWNSVDEYVTEARADPAIVERLWAAVKRRGSKMPVVGSGGFEDD